MAPEQLLEQEITPRTDLYALGCVLYLLLAGRPPFIADRPGRGVPGQHINDKPIPPSAHGCGPDDLDDLVLRLLEKDPRDRPADTAEVLAVLSLHLPRIGDPAPDPALTPDPTVPFRAPDAVRASDAAPVVLAPNRAAPPRRVRARRFLSRAQASARLVQASEELRAGNPEAVRGDLENLLAEAVQSFGQPDVLIDRIRLALADSFRLIGECAVAAEHYAVLVGDRGALPNQGGEKGTIVLCAMLGEAECLAAVGRGEDGGVAVLRTCIPLVATLPRALADEVADRCRDLGVQLMELGHDVEAARHLLQELPERVDT